MLLLKLFWFTESKKGLFFSYMLQLCYIYASYIVKTVCWYVCLSLVFIVSDKNIVYTSTRCLRSHMPDLL